MRYITKEIEVDIDIELDDFTDEEIREEYLERFGHSGLLNEDEIVDQIRFGKSPREIINEILRKTSNWSLIEE